MSKESDAKEYNEEAQRARIAVANAIFAWASLEDKLVTLLGAALHTVAGSPMASAVYFAPSNIETRLNIVDRVVCEFPFTRKNLEGPFLAEWAAVLGKINRLKNTRNKLAHASLVGTPNPSRTKRVVRVASQIYDVQRRRDSKEAGQLPGMSPADVEAHVKAIQALIPIVEGLRDLIWASNYGPEAWLERLAELAAARTSQDRQ